MTMNCRVPAAGIRISITKFQKIPFVNSRETCTEADVLLVGNANGKVSQPEVNAPIRVDSGAVVDLVFVVDTSDGTDEIYQPMGIAFTSHGGGVGMDDFPTRTIDADAFNGMRLTVHDANVAGKSFDFKVLIQRESDGALGVVDPQIKNG